MISRLTDVSRREFIKYCAGTAAALGLPQSVLISRVSAALARAAAKPPVLWLEGQACTGCTISLAGSLDPSFASLLLDTLSLRYHDAVMAGTGHVAEAVFRETVTAGGHLLCVEGSIPAADDRFCMVGGRPFRKILEEAASTAAAVIAVGACASFGGIPAAGPTGAVGVGKVITDRPVVNVSTCPVHADHLVGTILYLLTTGKLPPLDYAGRPNMYFSQNIHDNCRRRSYFDEDLFLEDWNDPAQKNWCLYNKGCKGPDTDCDCPVRRWHGGLGLCFDAGAPCQGCAEPTFYADLAPLYAEKGQPSAKRIARRHRAPSASGSRS